MIEPRIDLAWFRAHAVEEILPRWLAVAPHENGFLQPQIDRAWRRKEQPFATLVSQTRLLFNFAQGFALTGDERYRAAVERGVGFLLRHFRDAPGGGWHWSVAPDGRPIDRSRNTYGLAFAVFGLSHAARCLGDPACLAAALETRRFLAEALTDAEGGYYQGVSEDLSSYTEPTRRSQNPVMHLFEALLALEAAGGGAEAREAVDGLWRFVGGRLLRDDDLIPETFDVSWRPLADEDGGWINIGHQFEWAYLLAEAERMGHGGGLAAVGRRLLGRALEIGVAASDGGVLTRARMDTSIAPEDAAHRGWWEQCEASRALLRYGLGLGEPALLGPLAANIGCFRRRLIDPEYGGWYVEADPRDPYKGSEWKIDYHLVGLCMEAVRLAEPPPA